MAYGDARWTNLVAETQFSADLVLTGIRRVSRLPMEGNIFGEVAYDQTYPLYVDLHAYTSGLEHLRKLVLACDGFMKEGSFSPVRGYSHRIDELLDAVGSLDLSGVHMGRVEASAAPAPRPARASETARLPRRQARVLRSGRLQEPKRGLLSVRLTRSFRPRVRPVG